MPGRHFTSGGRDSQRFEPAVPPGRKQPRTLLRLSLRRGLAPGKALRASPKPAGRRAVDDRRCDSRDKDRLSLYGIWSARLRANTWTGQLRYLRSGRCWSIGLVVLRRIEEGLPHGLGRWVDCEDHSTRAMVRLTTEHPYGIHVRQRQGPGRKIVQNAILR